MKHTSWVILFASVLVLLMAGCGSAPNATPIPSISLDAPDASTTSQVQASAVVVPAQETRLSFVIAGMVWALQLVLQWRDFFKQLVNLKILDVLVDILYFIVPNTCDLSDLTVDLAPGVHIASWAPLYTSIGFALVLFVVTLVIFNRKNY